MKKLLFDPTSFIDSSISKEEFLNITAAIYEKRFGVTLSQQDMEVEEMKFTIIDKDRTNCIDWWEFLTYEALSILSKRPKVGQALYNIHHPHKRKYPCTKSQWKCLSSHLNLFTLFFDVKTTFSALQEL